MGKILDFNLDCLLVIGIFYVRFGPHPGFVACSWDVLGAILASTLDCFLVFQMFRVILGFILYCSLLLSMLWVRF